MQKDVAGKISALSITQQERELLWVVLSDLFVDSSVHWRYIVRTCLEYEEDLIKTVLLDEVAPVCGPNLCAVIPPVWSGFDEEGLIKDIVAHLAWRKGTVRQRAVFALNCLFWRRHSAPFWRELHKRLELTKAADSPEALESILQGPDFEDD